MSIVLETPPQSPTLFLISVDDNALIQVVRVNPCCYRHMPINTKFLLTAQLPNLIRHLRETNTKKPVGDHPVRSIIRSLIPPIENRLVIRFNTVPNDIGSLVIRIIDTRIPDLVGKLVADGEPPLILSVAVLVAPTSSVERRWR